MSTQGLLLERLREVLAQEAAAIRSADSESLRGLVAERASLVAGLGPIEPANRRLAAELDDARDRNERAALDRLAEMAARLRALNERGGGLGR